MTGIGTLPPNNPAPPPTPTGGTTPSPGTPAGGTPPPSPPPAPPPSPGGGTTPTPTPSPAPITPVSYTNMQVGYFKINLESTKTNMYGEALEKWYYPPSIVPCLIDRGETSSTLDEFGVGLSQTITVKIPTSIMQSYNFLAEIGDIVTDRERYYEVSSVDSQFVTLPGTSNASNTATSGVFALYVLTCYLTRTTKLNLIEYYQ